LQFVFVKNYRLTFLATTLIYASRTKRNPLSVDDFYCLLYLANDMEEDIEFKVQKFTMKYILKFF